MGACAGRADGYQKAMRTRYFLATLAGWAFLAPGSLAAEPDMAPVKAWIEHARTVKTVAADFRQERFLRAVAKPLVAQGKFWYKAPGAMRWQLGEPPRLILLRPGDAKGSVRLIDTQAKTVRPLSEELSKDQGGLVAFLDAGFPASVESFQEMVRISSIDRADGIARVTCHLRDSRLAVAVMKMVFVLDEAKRGLTGVEVWLRDGSKIINHFLNVQENAAAPEDLFKVPAEGFREEK